MPHLDKVTRRGLSFSGMNMMVKNRLRIIFYFSNNGVDKQELKGHRSPFNSCLSTPLVKFYHDHRNIIFCATIISCFDKGFNGIFASV